MIRSFLFVPGDSERKLAKAKSIPADALVLDLEDAVLPERKQIARKMVCDFLESVPDRARYWVRVNDLQSNELLKDVAAIAKAQPAGIVLPKVMGPEDIQQVCRYLEILEVVHSLPPDSISIIAVITETPMAVLRMGELAQADLPRLKAVMWGGEDLSAAMGAGDPRHTNGSWRDTYVHARIQCLLAAHSLGIEAIDTVYVDFQDLEGLKRSCHEARHDGFTGRIAIHPTQVAVINEAFSPSEEELSFAHRLIESFENGSGVVSIDGRMYDIPHLKWAQRMVETAKQIANRGI